MDRVHQALSYSNSSAIIARFTGALITYSVSFPPFLVLGLVVAAFLIVQWKNMVRVKRVFYVFVIFICLLQLLSTTGGILYSTCVLAGNIKACMDTFAMIQYASAMLTVILCYYCFLLITRVLYKVYFDKSQWWMRGSELGDTEKTVSVKTAARNQKYAKFVKWSVIVTLVIMSIVAPLHIIAIIITSLTSLMPISETLAHSIGSTRNYIDAPIAVGYWSFIFYFGILNIHTGYALTRKLLSNQELVTAQRRRACRQLRTLVILQFIMGAITGSIVIMGALALVRYEIFIAGITIQRLSIFGFAIALAFAYGPMDHLDLRVVGERVEMMAKKILPTAKKDMEELQVVSCMEASEKEMKKEGQESNTTTTVSDSPHSSPSSGNDESNICLTNEKPVENVV